MTEKYFVLLELIYQIFVILNVVAYVIRNGRENMIKIGKIRKEEYLAWLMIALIILLSGSVFVSIESAGTFRNFLYVLFYICGLVMLLTITGKLSLRRSMLGAVVFPLILVIISSVNFPSTSFDAIKMLSIFYMLLITVEYCNRKCINYKKVAYNIILFLAVITFLLYVVVELLNINISSSVVINGPTRYLNYYNLYFTENMFRYWVFGKELHRLQSIFTEPGIFAIYLNYAIYLHLYDGIEDDKRKLFLLCLSLFLTLSTTGLCLGIAQISFYFYKSIKSRESRIIVLIPLVAIVGTIMLDVFMRKATMDVNINGSYYLRSTDIIIGLQVWTNHMLIGTGYINHDPFISLQPVGRGCSNGIIQWLYTTGIVGLGLLLSPFIISVIKSKSNILERKRSIVLFVLYLICGMTEPIIITPFMMMIVANRVYHNNMKILRRIDIHG